LNTNPRRKSVRFLINLLVNWPERLAGPFAWLGPLLARFAVGWVFMWSGWGKLNNLPVVIENFVGWTIPQPQILAPFVSGVEFVGGLCLILGLFTRIAAAPLVVVMAVAIRSALWDQVDSLQTFLGFEEFVYLTVFLWLAIAGPGAVSLDRLLQRLSPPSH
jgi:putative oxidoreductase